jgi:hypothetical protein
VPVKRSTFSCAVLIWALSGCAAPGLEVEPSGIPDRTVTECQKVAATNLGSADSVFTCRGTFVDGPEGFVAAYKGRASDSYSLLSINPGGEAVGRRVTEHRGPQFLLARLEKEIMLATWSGSYVRYGMHGAGLGGRSAELRDLQLTAGRVLDVAAASVPSAGGGFKGRAVGGVILAVASGFGVEVWLLDEGGEVVVTRQVLVHPEMEYCDSVQVRSVPEGGFAVTLVCNGVLPLKPEARERQVVVRDFNWGAKIEGGRTIAATYDDDLHPVDVEMTTSLPTAAPARYALRRYLEDQIPREPGERLRVVDAVTVDGGQYLSLGCIGADDAAVRVEATLMTCDGAP